MPGKPSSRQRASFGLEDGPAAFLSAQLGVMDHLRRLEAGALDRLGYAPRECPFDVVASGPRWRLRHYPGGDAGSAALLMVPAPIKRPSVWDLDPRVSVVRFCLEQGFDVHLVEWLPPDAGDGSAGVEAYAGAILAAARIVAARQPGRARLVLGHSLGGTLAALAGALQPDMADGLVLLGAPLSFAPGSSPFRDLVAAQRRAIPDEGIVPGAQLSQACALLAPATFVWSRWMDGALSFADPAAFDLHVRIERWALDEVALPGRLVREMVEWLYREDRFTEGSLVLAGRTLGPGDLRLPVLAVVSEADEIGPAAAVAPFFARMKGGDTGILTHPAEIGVGLQHLAILAGRHAHARTWPRIAAWIEAHAAAHPVAGGASAGKRARSSMTSASST